MNNEFSMDRVSADMIDMMAKQMGAVRIKSDSAHISTYTFLLADDTVIQYMLQIRRNKGMYLHRVTPYPMVLGKFFGEADVTDYMKRDLDKFRNAHHSENFPRFLELAENLTQFNRQIEQLFLNRNVSAKAFDELCEEMTRIRGTIEQVAEESPMLYASERLVGDPSDDR